MKQALLLFFFSISLFAQKTTELIKSNKLGETREITISLPASYENSSTKRYPVLLLLDGDYLFDPFQGALKYGEYWDDLPEMIIIGINQKNSRMNDCAFDPAEGTPTKRSAAFYNFIGEELVPFIDKKYRTAPFRIIAGHDTTAGFLNFFLYKENSFFNAYISLSPELAPGMESQIATNLSNAKKPIFYYQSSADGDIKQLLQPIEELDAQLKSITNPLVNYQYNKFSNASHYSLVLFSVPNALYQIFDSYKPISSTEFTEKIAILPSGYVDYLIKKYQNTAEKLGLQMPIRINDFKAIEAAILKNKAYDELEKLAQIASKNYPKAMLADYELGLMYEKTGDAKKAAAKYQRASQLEEIGDLTKEMMYNKYDDMKSLTVKK
ncbi:alpha/beta hydrolase [Flavobacterium commune]|uniref:Histidine kinase n=1 Tax=Flavobacterium commune TaxID=1306519 RepID=A0A1D9PA05_9FLAO|nr:alpha/beta hydrolase-fold protein [Flavobacterium commune]AOZ98925.1 histidine kinase [Flavobacterium commune]